MNVMYQPHPVQRSEGNTAGGMWAYNVRANLTASNGQSYVAGKQNASDLLGTDIIYGPDVPNLSAVDLWASIEQACKRRDAQLAINLRFSIPRGLSYEESRAFAQAVIKKNYPGRTATLAYHCPGGLEHGSNPHCHALIAMRAWDKKKGGWGNQIRGNFFDKNKQLAADKAAFLSIANPIVARLAAEHDCEPDLWTCDSYEKQYADGRLAVPRVPSKHVGPKGTKKDRAKQKQIVADQQAIQDRARELDQIIADADATIAREQKKKENIIATHARGQAQLERIRGIGTCPAAEIILPDPIVEIQPEPEGLDITPVNIPLPVIDQYSAPEPEPEPESEYLNYDDTPGVYQGR